MYSYNPGQKYLENGLFTTKLSPSPHLNVDEPATGYFVPKYQQVSTLIWGRGGGRQY